MFSKNDFKTNLLGLLPLEFVIIVSRESDSVPNNYDHVKNLLLKSFKLMTEEFRQKKLYRIHSKMNSNTLKYL